ncbi:hypothetical protein [uncultured Catenibacterium sp.]|uniref:hypothetical protein n=1 Tax=uncultured Catenibacterium sp. TaxID=286142 RepID=UPI0025DBEAE4|nr:hypothetical protein [uncultured Catenibacterium sp.]
MNNRLFVKVNLLVIICLLACPVGGFLAEHIGSVPTGELFLMRTTQYASSIRVGCMMMLIYFIFGEKQS